MLHYWDLASHWFVNLILVNMAFKNISKHGTTIFNLICVYSFIVALVIILKVPGKYILTISLVPVGLFGTAFLIVRYVFRIGISNLTKQYKEIKESQNLTQVFKSILLPLLLVALYYYIRSAEEGQKTLYSESAIQVEMLVHPCGSSFERNSNGGYSSVWDAVDLISQPSENEVFIITNSVVGVKQTQSRCAQTGAYCSTTSIYPGRIQPRWLQSVSWAFSHDFSRAAIWNPVTCPKFDDDEFENRTCEAGILYDNGIQEEDCNVSNNLCSIQGWCPPISLNSFSTTPKFDIALFTIFLDLRPDFYEFKEPSWTDGGKDGYAANYADIYARFYGYTKSIDNCIYSQDGDPYCPRFQIKDIVELAGADLKEITAFGGNIHVSVMWNCNFDWGRDIYNCLPEFQFRKQANNRGKPKINSQVTRSSDINNPERVVNFNLGVHITIDNKGNGYQIGVFNIIFYVQFVYVSYQMIKEPSVAVIRGVYTIITILLKLKSEEPEVGQDLEFNYANSNS